MKQARVENNKEIVLSSKQANTDNKKTIIDLEEVFTSELEQKRVLARAVLATVVHVENKPLVVTTHAFTSYYAYAALEEVFPDCIDKVNIALSLGLTGKDAAKYAVNTTVPVASDTSLHLPKTFKL